MNSQVERTRLAWRRTALAVLVVAGLGALHLATAGLLFGAVFVGVVALLGCVPTLHRLTALRERETDVAWEPLLLTVTACLMALAVLVPA